MVSEETLEAPKKIRLKADKSRFSNLISVDQLIAMQEGNVKTLRDVLALFLLDESNNYYALRYEFKKHRKVPLPSLEALEIIGILSIAELNEASAEFLLNVNNEVVPPPNAPDSEQP